MIIFFYFREYVHNPDLLISSQAISSIGIIALKNRFAIEICVNALLDLLQLDVHYITGNCLESLQGDEKNRNFFIL